MFVVVQHVDVDFDVVDVVDVVGVDFDVVDVVGARRYLNGCILTSDNFEDCISANVVNDDDNVSRNNIPTSTSTPSLSF